MAHIVKLEPNISIPSIPTVVKACAPLPVHIDVSVWDKRHAAYTEDSAVVDAFDDDDLKESEMTPEQRKAAGARCKQLGYLTASEAQKRLLMAINNFNRASAGKLLEPNK